VLEQESQVIQQVREAQATFKTYAASFNRKHQIELSQAKMVLLQQEINALVRDIEAFRLQLAQMPRVTNVDKDEVAQVEYRRNQCEALVNDYRFNLNTLRSQLPNPGAIRELDAEIRSGRLTCESAIREVSGLIESTDAKYHDLQKDDQVKHAIAELERIGKVKLKLGPSEPYNEMVKQAKQFDRMLKSQATMKNRSQ
jgi:hypothetical protein